MTESGFLYVVATPIGNPEDITLRALRILQESNAVICEEVRQGSTILHKLGIKDKELIPLNEHNETIQTSLIIQRMLIQKHSFALISDCGTPVFADPGYYLIDEAIEFGIRVIPVPGPSSLMAALSTLNYKLDQFTYAGFLPREIQQRQNELYRLKALKTTVILMDAPYRLGALLDDTRKVFGKGCKITLCCNLTLPTEAIYRGSISEVMNQVGKRKAEFILILHS